MMKTLNCFIAVLFCFVSTVVHGADQYPSRVVKIIVPWPAGGAADTIARFTADILSKKLGQPFIVDNRPGAGTNIGTEVVAKASPDGYTLLLSSSNNAVNMTLYKNVRYDFEKDFEPISVLANVPNILVVNPQVPAKNVEEFIAYARANPGKLKVATAGNGSPAHLAAEQFKRMAKINMLIVPYKGAPPAITDLIAGFVDVMFANAPVSLGMIKSGRLNALAICSQQKSIALPELPTVAASGVPNFEVSSWYGLMAPKGTPQEVLEKISVALNEAKTVELNQNLILQGIEPVISTSSEMAAQIKSDVANYKELIEATGIQIE